MAAGNSTFTTFLSSTIRNYRSQLIENLIDQQALLWQMRSRGMIEEEAGSRSIVQSIMYGLNDTVSSYSGWDLLDVTPQEGITSAEFDWKFIAGSYSISGEEEFKNSGSKTRIFNLFKAKIRQLRRSLQLELNSQLFGDGTGNSGKDITGLALAVEDGTAWSSYGGIDSSDADNSWWRNQFLDFDASYTDFNTASNNTVEGLIAMRQMFNDCSVANESPTLIVTTQDLFESYEQNLEGEKLRTSTTAMGDAGFQALQFKGVPMVYDSDCDANTMLFLNSRYLKFVHGKGRNFVTLPAERPEQQDAKVGHVLWAGNLVCTKRDQQGRIADFIAG